MRIVCKERETERERVCGSEMKNNMKNPLKHLNGKQLLLENAKMKYNMKQLCSFSLTNKTTKQIKKVLAKFSDFPAGKIEGKRKTDLSKGEASFGRFSVSTIFNILKIRTV